MWTLEAMNRFVLNHGAVVECKSCAGSNKHGKLYFKPCLVIYADWDDEKLEDVARVGCDVMLDHKSCFCQLTTEEFEWGRNEAHKQLMIALKMFLHPDSKSASEPSVAPLVEEQLSLMKVI